MNRKIKFKAWDEDRKYMITSDLDHIDFEKNIAYWYDVTADIEPDGSQGEPYQIQAASYDIVPLQYTGLKDKNGVEIYEGDVVKIKNQKGTVEFGNPCGKPNQIYEESSVWGFYVVSIFDESCLKENPFDCEVIGNIYENPELIVT